MSQSGGDKDSSVTGITPSSKGRGRGRRLPTVSPTVPTEVTVPATNPSPPLSSSPATNNALVAANGDCRSSLPHVGSGSPLPPVQPAEAKLLSSTDDSQSNSHSARATDQPKAKSSGSKGKSGSTTGQSMITVPHQRAVHDYAFTRPPHVLDNKCTEDPDNKLSVPLNVVSNLVQLTLLDPSTGTKFEADTDPLVCFQYHVDTSQRDADGQRMPQAVDAVHTRRLVLQAFEDAVKESGQQVTVQTEGMWKYDYNGQILYSRQRIRPDLLRIGDVHNEHVVTVKDKVYGIELRETASVRATHAQALTVLNVVNRKALMVADYRPFGRNHYDVNRKWKCERLPIDVWPGAFTSIRPYERGIYLQIDPSFKVIRACTVLDMIRQSEQSYGKEEGQRRINEELVNSTVMITYGNNKMHQVGVIKFDMTLHDTFERTDGSVISFGDYYAQQHNATELDWTQPLLYCPAKRTGPLRKDMQMDVRHIYLVPQLCRPTGLTKEMRDQRHNMQELMNFMRPNPTKRLAQTNEHLAKLSEGMPSELLRMWGMHIPRELDVVPARRFKPITLLLGDKQPLRYDASTADWSRDVKFKKPFRLPERLSDWLWVIPAPPTPQQQRMAGPQKLRSADHLKKVNEQFYGALREVANKIGYSIAQPTIKTLPAGCGNEPHNYVTAIEEGLADAAKAGRRVQLVVVCRLDNGKVGYDAVKQYTLTQGNVLTQVVLVTSMERDSIRISIAAKVLCQMIAKLGGAPWAVGAKFSRTAAPVMLVGYDSYMDSSERGVRVGSTVATTDHDWTQFYTVVEVEAGGTQPSLVSMMAKQLAAFGKRNGGQAPSRILLYRSGVGEGQVPAVQFTERDRLIDLLAGTGTKLTFTIVNKRVNHRFYQQSGTAVHSAPPGTVVSDVVTRRERYDFYVTSAAAGEGTAAPVAYNIIHDENDDVPPTKMHYIAHQCTHGYYNWQGTIRVPMVSMYAFKAAYMSSQHVHLHTSQPIDESLKDRLYFL